MAQVTQIRDRQPISRPKESVMNLTPRLHPHARLKRALDIVVSGSLLLILLPFLLAVAAMVRLTSRGPAIYVSRRIGVLGQEFRFYKFRTMISGADQLQDKVESDHSAAGWKCLKDPRITPIGKFLRKFSIDELPQLFHVLEGSMSLVGPRPPVQAEVDAYASSDFIRLTVKPGLTCFWQVMGRSDLDFDERIALDRRYVEEMSIMTDIKILAMTPNAVFSGRGAY